MMSTQLTPLCLIIHCVNQIKWTHTLVYAMSAFEGSYHFARGNIYNLMEYNNLTVDINTGRSVRLRGTNDLFVGGENDRPNFNRA